MGVVKDTEGNSYTTVVISGQEWMCENLKCNPKAGVASVYNNDNANLAIYGYLYDWAAAKSFNDYDYIAGEKGWHLPSDGEWKALEMALGMSSSDANDVGWRGTDQGAQLKEGGSSGLNMKLGGIRYTNESSYMGMEGYYWTSHAETNVSFAKFRCLRSDRTTIDRGGTMKSYGLSVRLVRQAPIPTIEVPDILISKGGQLHSLRGQTIWKDGAGHTFNTGCGVVKNGILYALKEAVPVYMQYFVPTGNESVGTEINLIDERDGILYRCIKMADGRWWMGENLKYETATGSYVYDDNPANLVIYGRLYKWDGIPDQAPTNWHIPTNAEWKALADALGGASIAGGKMKQVGTSLWNAPNTGATNESGWNGLPGGRYYNGSYVNKGYSGTWWSAEDHNYWALANNNAGLAGPDTYNNSARIPIRYILEV